KLGVRKLLVLVVIAHSSSWSDEALALALMDRRACALVGKSAAASSATTAKPRIDADMCFSLSSRSQPAADALSHTCAIRRQARRDAGRSARAPGAGAGRRAPASRR